jgi:hypothetical protein
MENKYTTVKIKKTTLARLRKLAEVGFRSPPEQIDCMVNAFEIIGIQSVTMLPRPPGANVVPVVTITKATD